MGKGIVKLGEGNWAVKDGNLLAAKETNGRLKNTEFTVSRGTRASYVGRDGLIKESNLQDVNLVNNGDFSELGSELVTNGTFDADSDWSKSGSWTYDSLNQSYKTTNDSISSLQQNGVTQVGKTYKLTFDVTSAPNGFNDFRIINSSWSDTYVDANEAQLGENTFYINVVNGTGIRFRVENLYEIDNISVKQIDPNDYWTFSGDSFTFPDGAARIARTTNTTFIQQNVLTSGKLYKVEFDVLDKDDNSGTFIVRLGSNNVYDVSTYEGTRFSKYITSAGIDFRIYSSSDNGVIYVDNIVVSEVKTDTPRIDFTDNTDGHLLLEPQSTNLLTYSEDFTNWTKLNGGTGSLPVVTSNTSSSNPLTVSLYVKSTGSGNDNFNLYTGALNVSDLKTATSEWQRFDYTADGSSMYIINSGDTYASDIYIWGAQSEALSHSTSYIPTNGSTVTRDADTCTDAGEAIDFNSEEGVLYAEISSFKNGGIGDRTISISDGSTQNAIQLFLHNTANRINFRLRSGGSLDVNISDFTFEQNQINKIACKYKSGDYALWINGEERATSTSSSLPSGLSVLAFNDGSLYDFYGKVKAIRVYKEALSDTDLQNLTS